MTTYYWTGNNGNAYNDRLNWSLTSGGGSAPAYPTASDDIVFDGHAYWSYTPPYGYRQCKSYGNECRNCSILYTNYGTELDLQAGGLLVHGDLNGEYCHQNGYNCAMQMVGSGKITGWGGSSSGSHGDIYYLDVSGTYTMDVSCGVNSLICSGSLTVTVDNDWGGGTVSGHLDFGSTTQSFNWTYFETEYGFYCTGTISASGTIRFQLGYNAGYIYEVELGTMTGGATVRIVRNDHYYQPDHWYIKIVGTSTIDGDFIIGGYWGGFDKPFEVYFDCDSFTANNYIFDMSEVFVTHTDGTIHFTGSWTFQLTAPSGGGYPTLGDCYWKIVAVAGSMTVDGDVVLSPYVRDWASDLYFYYTNGYGFTSDTDFELLVGGDFTRSTATIKDDLLRLTMFGEGGTAYCGASLKFYDLDCTASVTISSYSDSGTAVNSIVYISHNCDIASTKRMTFRHDCQLRNSGTTTGGGILRREVGGYDTTGLWVYNGDLSAPYCKVEYLLDSTATASLTVSDIDQATIGDLELIDEASPSGYYLVFTIGSGISAMVGDDWIVGGGTTLNSLYSTIDLTTMTVKNQRYRNTPGGTWNHKYASQIDTLSVESKGTMTVVTGGTGDTVTTTTTIGGTLSCATIYAQYFYSVGATSVIITGTLEMDNSLSGSGSATLTTVTAGHSIHAVEFLVDTVEAGSIEVYHYRTVSDYHTGCQSLDVTNSSIYALEKFFIDRYTTFTPGTSSIYITDADYYWVAHTQNFYDVFFRNVTTTSAVPTWTTVTAHNLSIEAGYYWNLPSTTGASGMRNITLTGTMTIAGHFDWSRSGTHTLDCYGFSMTGVFHINSTTTATCRGDWSSSLITDSSGASKTFHLIMITDAVEEIHSLAIDDEQSITLTISGNTELGSDVALVSKSALSFTGGAWLDLNSYMTHVAGEDYDVVRYEPSEDAIRDGQGTRIISKGRLFIEPGAILVPSRMFLTTPDGVRSLVKKVTEIVLPTGTVKYKEVEA